MVTRRGSARSSRVLATWTAFLALLLTILVSPISFARPTLGHSFQAPADLPRLRAQAGARSLRASDRDDAAKLGFTPQRSTEGEHAAEHEGVGEVDAAKRRRVGAHLSPLHDPDGHRIARIVSSTTANVTTFPDEEYFAWTGGNVVARLEKTGAVRQGFLFEGIDKPLRLRDTASNLKYYYELDIAGNVRRLRRTDGSDAGGYRYSGFGVQYPADQQTPIAAVDQPLRWKGRWWSDFANIYDVRARQWSPELGSFTSIDEVAFHDPLGTLWGWPRSSPIRFWDPSGHRWSVDPNDWDDDTQQYIMSGEAASDTAKYTLGIELMLATGGLAAALELPPIAVGVAGFAAFNLASDNVCLQRELGPSDEQAALSLALVALAVNNANASKLPAAASGDATGDLTGAAARAKATMGPGRGPVYGTLAHSEFRGEVEALGRTDLSTEVSYREGRVVPYGTRGSVRLDVVQGPTNAPTAVFDFKTGSAKLSGPRIVQIRQHLPAGSQDIPVLEIR